MPVEKRVDRLENKTSLCWIEAYGNRENSKPPASVEVQPWNGGKESLCAISSFLCELVPTSQSAPTYLNENDDLRQARTDWQNVGLMQDKCRMNDG